jgi:hypothetical protein
MGSLLHKAANNHCLPALLKERYGGLKKFLQSHPRDFVLGTDHPYNPHVFLRASYHQSGAGGGGGGVPPSALAMSGGGGGGAEAQFEMIDSDPSLMVPSASAAPSSAAAAAAASASASAKPWGVRSGAGGSEPHPMAVYTSQTVPSVYSHSGSAVADGSGLMDPALYGASPSSASHSHLYSAHGSGSVTAGSGMPHRYSTAFSYSHSHAHSAHHPPSQPAAAFVHSSAAQSVVSSSVPASTSDTEPDYM